MSSNLVYGCLTIHKDVTERC